MNKKLTLSIDEDLVKFAHHYSNEAHSSISDIVEKFFIFLKTTNQNDKIKFSKKTTELIGAYKKNKLPSKQEMRNTFHEDHIS